MAEASFSGDPSTLTPAERAALIDRNMPLVYKVVTGFGSSALKFGVDRADLIQEGSMALVIALNRYKPGTGASFATFATYRVRGAIIDFLRSQSFSSRGAIECRRQIEQMVEHFTHRWHRPPTDPELCQMLDWDMDQLKRVRHRIRGTYSFYEIDTVTSAISSSTDNSHALTSNSRMVTLLTEDESSNVETLIGRQDEKERVNLAIAALPKPHGDVIHSRYILGQTHEAVCKNLRISPMRVLKLQKEGLAMLREAFVASEIGSAPRAVAA